MTYVIDGSLINRQRLALGLTRHELTQASGVSWLTLEKLEETRWADATHLISTVSRVGHALGLRPTDLLDRGTEPRSPPPDVHTVGVLLATHPNGLGDDVIARALGWSTGQVSTAIATLTEQLQAAGQTVRRTDGHSQLAPAANPLDPERVQAIARRSDPLDPDDARALLRVLRASSRNRYWEDFTADEHESIMRLIAQGALTDTGATVQPSVETREALTQGYRTTEGDFPPASRFRTESNTPTAQLHRARQLPDRHAEHELA